MRVEVPLEFHRTEARADGPLGARTAVAPNDRVGSRLVATDGIQPDWKHVARRRCETLFELSRAQDFQVGWFLVLNPHTHELQRLIVGDRPGHDRRTIAVEFELGVLGQSGGLVEFFAHEPRGFVTALCPQRRVALLFLASVDVQRRQPETESAVPHAPLATLESMSARSGWRIMIKGDFEGPLRRDCTTSDLGHAAEY